MSPSRVGCDMDSVWSFTVSWDLPESSRVLFCSIEVQTDPARGERGPEIHQQRRKRVRTCDAPGDGIFVRVNLRISA